ncbi:TRAP transporter large permease subunit [Chloroflexota bacterium]
MFGLLLALLATGLPIAFCLGSTALIFGYFLWGPASLAVIVNSAYSQMGNFILVAVPLFVFMGIMLERSGIADALFGMMHVWFGSLRGGLGIGTIAVCAIFAAMSGLSSTGTVTMGLIALPAMLKRGYDKRMAIGSVGAGGGLGVLIPPSVPLIFFAWLAGESVGRLFLGGVFPGLLLATLYASYIGIRSFFQPHLGPALPPEERGSWREKGRALRAVILPILLVIAVLGSIFTGMATPSEAAAMGAFGSIICAIVYRRLRWRVVKETAYRTAQITAMMLWITIAAKSFTVVYTGIGGPELVRGLVQGAELSPWIILIAMQVIWIIMGCIMDPMGITMITIPIFLPIAKFFGFDIVWFGLLHAVNMEMGLLTPPFGWNLFYLKGIAPEGISIRDIYSSVFPFITLQALALVIIMLFPQIVLFLPNLILGK